MRQVRNIAAVGVLGTATLVVCEAQAFAQMSPQQNSPKAPPGCGPRILVEYTDDDPDYFIIKNRSPEGWSLVMLGIDFGPSAGALVFDTDEGGPGAGGAAAFYPHSASPIRLVGTAPAEDGGKSIALHFDGFSTGLDYSFNVDVDAMPSGGGRTWVLPQDIKGTRVLATFKGSGAQREKIEAIFDERATADSGAGGCV